MSPLAPAFLLSALALSVPYSSSQAASLDKGVVATVNGNPITEIAVSNVADQIRSQGENAVPENILNELINLEVLTQAAENIKLNKVPEVAAAIQLQYNQTMANAYLARISSELSFSEEEVRAEYDVQTSLVDHSEYLTSHILVASERAAVKVVEDLDSGIDFADLAKLSSTDPTGESGGDLGWIQGTALPPEFAEVVSNLEVGEYSKTSIKTEFGFHILKLNDKREAGLPDFKSVEQGLVDLLTRKALAQHLEDLRSWAEIEQ